MKQPLVILSSLLMLSGSTQLHAQPGSAGGPGGSSTGPQLNPQMLKLFGDHKAFSADLEFQVTEGGKGDPMTLPGKIAVQDGKTRFEMNLLEAKGGSVPENAAAQLKQFGMDKMVIISLPARKVSCLVYPGLEAYYEVPVEDEEADQSEADFTLEITEIGRETIDGHECIKNKVAVKGKDGKTNEATTWNATDLEKFPIKIQTTEEGNLVGLLFKDVNLAAPGADAFTPPSSYTKYDNMMSMMQQAMMKKMGGAGMPGGK